VLYSVGLRRVRCGGARLGCAHSVLLSVTSCSGELVSSSICFQVLTDRSISASSKLNGGDRGLEYCIYTYTPPSN
jgi:hypothetical protein